MAKRIRRFGVKLAFVALLAGVAVLLGTSRSGSADPSGGGPGPAAAAPQGDAPHKCRDGSRVGPPPPDGRGDCETCITPPVTGGGSTSNSYSTTDGFGDGTRLNGGTIVPDTQALMLEVSGDTPG